VAAGEWRNGRRASL